MFISMFGPSDLLAVLQHSNYLLKFMLKANSFFFCLKKSLLKFMERFFKFKEQRLIERWLGGEYTAKSMDAGLLGESHLSL